ncbi:single-strand DNA endonuclease ASTE1 [Dermacentor andersoni]|uniref:single-strand DNA endonuclease ASTE1 n=1 Tax=Dermacentor andersoni TaxID=34620 RepID=UPI0021555E18|nr:protein asteroid homolog 1-like [Dermacentor andersoni]
MGVHGLSSFFTLNPDLSEWRNLHSTKLVVDGNNLIYMIYFTSNLECVYGGDYDGYATAIRNYFAVFKACGIELILVFDGGHDVSNRKLKTTQRRLQERLATAKAIAKTGAPNLKILPILAHEVFKDVVRELGIPVFQCSFEADEEIAAIANHYECPVASQDSDFYIFNLTGGFIRLDSISTTLQTVTVENGQSMNALSCRWYHVDNLLGHFPGFDKSMLPLFATLMGNDFVNGVMFEGFFNSIKLPRLRSKKLKISKQHTKMVGLLYWLSTTSSDLALSQIMQTLKTARREFTAKVILDTMSRYEVCTSPFVDKLKDGTKMVLTDAADGTFPEWFSELYFSGILNPYLINIAAVHKVFHLTQIDCFELESSYACSLPLRQVLYGLVLSVNSKSKDLASVEEFDREGRNITRRFVEPILSAAGYGELPRLKEIPALTDQRRKDLFFRIFGVESIQDQCPESLHGLFTVICFWLKNSKLKVSENLFRSFLLGIVLLKLLPRTKLSSRKTSEKLKFLRNGCTVRSREGIGDILPGVEEQLSQDILCCVNKNFSKFFIRPTHNHAKRFDFELVYLVSQLQTCLLFARFLNRLLLEPCKNVEFHKTLNGTFLYNFTKELDNRVNPDLFIAEYLGRGTVLETEFSSFYKKIRGLLPEDSFSAGAAAGGKKKRKKREKAESCDVTEQQDDSFGLLSNRFEGLLREGL